jgi:hypothetical protein
MQNSEFGVLERDRKKREITDDDGKMRFLVAASNMSGMIERG